MEDSEPKRDTGVTSVLDAIVPLVITEFASDRAAFLRSETVHTVANMAHILK
jgi:hypothetical protein